jgi:hypothetical protein
MPPIERPAFNLTYKAQTEEWTGYGGRKASGGTHFEKQYRYRRPERFRAGGTIVDGCLLQPGQLASGSLDNARLQRQSEAGRRRHVADGFRAKGVDGGRGGEDRGAREESGDLRIQLPAGRGLEPDRGGVASEGIWNCVWMARCSGAGRRIRSARCRLTIQVDPLYRAVTHGRRCAIVLSAAIGAMGDSQIGRTVEVAEVKR